MLGLFIGGFLQAIIAVFHIRNVANLRIFAAMGTAFFFAIIWGSIIVGIVRDMSGPWSIVAYACGLSAGTGTGMYFGKAVFERYFSLGKEANDGAGTTKEKDGRSEESRTGER